MHLPVHAQVGTRARAQVQARYQHPNTLRVSEGSGSRAQQGTCQRMRGRGRRFLTSISRMTTGEKSMFTRSSCPSSYLR